jgi:peptide/nickel transport system permease protein
MIRRWLESRTFRKFVRNRMAIAALFVISLFLLMAVATSVFGLITLEETKRYVGPANVPGLGYQAKADQRANDVSQIVEQIERALKKDDFRVNLDNIELGQLKIVDLPRDELTSRVDRIWEIYDEISENENLDNNPELWPEIDKMESILYTELFEVPTGLTAFKRKLELLWGTDRQGRSIFIRAVYSIEIAMKIGIVVGLISVFIGTILGLAAGFYGGWVDHIVSWLFTVFSSIPSLVLLVLLAAMFRGSSFEGTLVPMYIAFSMTYWIGPCRVIRGEAMKLKEQEYVHAALVAGFSKPYIMLRHIMPNTAHMMLIYFSLLFIAAVKGEVILTYLGLGIDNGTSWGIMISQSGDEVINGFFWQIGAATMLMFFLVLAFNILSDALQDVFDPKHV